VFFALHAAAGSLRWLSARATSAVVPRPAQDALAAVYGLPGSYLALPSAVSRRVRPQRFRLPDRPLVWPAIALTLVSAVPLIEQGSGRGTPSDATVLFALVNLVLLWTFALHALLQRRWERSSYRFRTRLPVLVAGRQATTRDASPSGMAITGAFPEEMTGGAELPVSVALPDGSSIDATAVVAARHHHGDDDVLGLSLRFSPDDQVRWIRQLFSATVPEVAAEPVAEAAPGGAARVTRAVDRLAVGAVGIFSALAVVALVLVLMGYRPLVVRSGSMIPALQVGDLVIVDDIAAREMAVGDIVTFDDPEGRGDTITHRVVGITAAGGVLHVETKGDANELGESWSIGAEQTVGRNTVRVPEVGGVVAFAHERTRWILGVVGVACAAMVLLRTPRPRRRPVAPAARLG
jgi:signal peptidase I